MTKPGLPLPERFWGSPVHPKVDFTGSPIGCWVWIAARDTRNYGVINVGNQHLERSHRVSWELTNGVIPDGLCVLHRCDNPPCVNPDHLFLGTLKDNSQDMTRKGHNIGNRKDHKYLRDKSPTVKLNLAKAEEIRKRYATGKITTYALAREYGVSQSSVWQIIRRKIWKD